MYILMAIVFVLGYIAIALEHNIHVDKAASALLTAIVVWTLLVFGADTLLAEHLSDMSDALGHGSEHGAFDFINVELRHHLAEIAEILFFLMGAMVIVELIDAHDGFQAIINRITTTNAITLIWVIGILTFFLSAILDNLTTTIVMVSLLRKIIADKQQRLWFAGMVVICANAGGAWSPIGAVTTTMLWIGTQITAGGMIPALFVPSLVAALVPLAMLTFKFRGKQIARPVDTSIDALQFTPETPLSPATAFNPAPPVTRKARTTVLTLGLGALAFVPVFKTVTHLPPYMGIMFGVGVLWVVTELMHRHEDKHVKSHMTVVGVLTKVDMASILFFLGILLAVSALATAGHLADVAQWLDTTFGNIYIINVLIGLFSSMVDNVPLVAGAMKMYPLVDTATLSGLTGAELTHQTQFIRDGEFWHFLAYCAGTGGSCLIIGSAAGVAAMGMEKIPFMWYLKHISFLALMGYIAGAAIYVLIHVIM